MQSRAGGTAAEGSAQDASAVAALDTRLAAEAAQLLASALDYEAALDRVANLLVPARADWVLVDLLVDDAHFERVAVAHHHPRGDEIARATKRVYPLEAGSRRGVESAIRELRTQLLRNIDEATIRERARSDEHLRAGLALGVRSCITAPLIARGRAIGALTFAASDRDYSADDVRFVQQFAMAAAAAIDNARMFRAEQRARASLERMQAVIAALSRARTAAEVASAACHIAAEAMAAQSGAMWLREDDGSLSLAGTWGASERFMEGFRRFAPDADVPAQRVLRTGEAEWVETEQDFERTAPAIFPIAKAHGRLAAYGVVPMFGVRGPLGAITFGHPMPHPYDADERAFYRSVAQHCAQALERALLFDERVEQQRRIELLQSITASLSKAASAEEVAAVIVDEGAVYVGAPQGAVWCLSADRSALELTYSRGYGEGARAAFSRVPLEIEAPITRNVRDGASFWIESRADYERAFPELEATSRGTAFDEVAFFSTPLVVKDRRIGAMSFNWPAPRAFEPNEKRLVEALARQAALALERARLFDEAEAGRRRLLEASRVKDEFLAVVSHELRTPLNAVLGWASMLRTNPSLDVQRGIETIERNARAQLRLVEDMLDASRIITGKLKIHPKRTDLAGVLRAALTVVAPMAAAKGVALEAHVDEGPCAVYGDDDRLQQVFWNLLSNAVKFTPRDGRVTVRLSRAVAAVETLVSDTGCGIQPDFLPHVFDHFRQADASTTRTQSGLGLGLAIAHHIVVLHDGSITAQSPGRGKGATFTVTLPLHFEDAPGASRPASEPAAGPDAPAKPLAGLRIVVCDDDADARELLAVVLTQAGATVRLSSMAAEAMQYVEELRPDVLLSDIGLPLVDGYSLLQKVRSLPEERGGRTPAVALTAYASREDALQAFDAGYQVHLAKPIEPTELVAMVARVAGRAEGE